jgi:hypothetical protein
MFFRSEQLDAPEAVPIKLSWLPFDELVVESVAPIQEYRLFNIDHRDDSFRAWGKLMTAVVAPTPGMPEVSGSGPQKAFP